MAHRILYYSDGGIGWEPIKHMIGIGLRVLNAQFVDLSKSQPSLASRLRSTLIHPPIGGEGGDIFIARRPHDLQYYFSHPSFLDKRKFRAIWIIDSCFTEEWMKPTRRLLSHFDLVGYTQYRDSDFYSHLCGNRAVYLGWGTDALRINSISGERSIDILRVGRQPKEWDDDDQTARACEEVSLTFQGRPPIVDDHRKSYDDLVANWYSRSKIVIAHSNIVSPVFYGHVSKEYITARWADSLACGAIVAGVQPLQDIDLVNWNGALIHFDHIELKKNLIQISEFLQSWTIKTAENNKLEALRRLDWRWRFDVIARHLECGSQILSNELDSLQSTIDSF
jgi:hypothetical protein